MKSKVSFILLFSIQFTFFSLVSNAQKNPLGINFQSVIKNDDGTVFKKAPVRIQFEIFQEGSSNNIYTEVHLSETNNFGFYQVALGKGKAMKGRFQDIPWSSGELWVRTITSINDEDATQLTTETKLLSVPYAMHSITADRLSNDENISRNPDEIPLQPSDYWQKDGNDFNPRTDPILGTLSKHDLILVAAGNERLRIYQDGGFELKGDIFQLGNFDATGNLSSGGDITAGGSLTSTGDLTTEGNHYVVGDQLIDGDLTVGGEFNLQNKFNISAESENHVALFKNTNSGNGDGIGIQLGANKTSGANNFLTFMDGDGDVTGRIEGYDVYKDLLEGFPVPSEEVGKQIGCLLLSGSNPNIVLQNYTIEGLNSLADLWNDGVIPGWSIPDIPQLKINGFQLYGGLELPALPDVPSINFPTRTLTNGITLPDVPAWNLSETMGEMPKLNKLQEPNMLALVGCPSNVFPNGYDELLTWLGEFGTWTVTNDMREMMGFSVVELAAKTALWSALRFAKDGGVTYGSKGADYAEYLEKVNHNEQFMPGEVVGIFGGKISKKTEGADQILAISSMPLVLGNQPEISRQDDFEKVGFLGQVLTFVNGQVEVGDYIIPSGENDGTAIAISANQVSVADIPQIIGRAWSSSKGNSLELINVSVGMRPSEMAPILKKHEDRLEKVERALAKIQGAKT